MPQVLLYGIAVILIGVLQAHRRFLGPALGPLLSSLVVIAAYVIFGAVAAARGSRPVDADPWPRADPVGGNDPRRRRAGADPVGPGRAHRHSAAARPITSRPASRPPSARWRSPGRSWSVARTLRPASRCGCRTRAARAGRVVLYGLAWTVFTVPWAVARGATCDQRFPGSHGGVAARRPAGLHRSRPRGPCACCWSWCARPPR